MEIDAKYMNSLGNGFALVVIFLADVRSWTANRQNMPSYPGTFGVSMVTFPKACCLGYGVPDETASDGIQERPEKSSVC